jgi:hypothetical protein
MAKRGKIIGVYLVLVFLISGFIYFNTRSEPSCSDGIQNQRETGVDCGGPCQPCPRKIQPQDLQVIKAEAVLFRENSYDIVAEVKNPNDLLGATEITVEFSLIGENGKALAKISQKDNFILPQEKKHFFITGVKTAKTPVKAKARIISQKWQMFSRQQEPRLLVVNTHYNELSGGAADFAEVAGTLINKSGIDFETIKVKIFLKGEDGRILTVNSQIMNTVRAEERRDFIIKIPNHFEGKVADVEVEPETDIFNSENYIRVYGRPDIWKEDSRF